MTDRGPRPWDIRELDAGDARGLRRSAGRVVRRIPTLREQNNTQWRAADKWTRELLRELSRLGFDEDAVQGVDDKVILTGVGRRGMTLILRTPGAGDALAVERVTCPEFRADMGKDNATARQATLWLRKRAARTPRYLP